MYLWKVDKLVDDFKSDEVNQKEEFKYMLTFTIIMSLLTDPFLYIGSSYNINDFANTVLIIMISVWGIYYCYKIPLSSELLPVILFFLLHLLHKALIWHPMNASEPLQDNQPVRRVNRTVSYFQNIFLLSFRVRFQDISL